MKEIKQKNRTGFTLLEMLVVVLIIGILASIALPQYQMAVTKAKVASILPLMHRWKDALQEYKLQHGDYNGDGANLSATPLGVSWPQDWPGCTDEMMDCQNDYWYCMANEIATGFVYCDHQIDSDNYFEIYMYQPDESEYEDVRGMTTCEPVGTKGEKICKALGGKLLNDVEGWGSIQVYKLN